MNDSFPFSINTIDLCCEGFVLLILMIYRICHLEYHFNTIVAVCDVCHA